MLFLCDLLDNSLPTLDIKKDQTLPRETNILNGAYFKSTMIYFPFLIEIITRNKKTKYNTRIYALF